MLVVALVADATHVLKTHLLPGLDLVYQLCLLIDGLFLLLFRPRLRLRLWLWVRNTDWMHERTTRVSSIAADAISAGLRGTLMATRRASSGSVSGRASSWSVWVSVIRMICRDETTRS